MPVDPNNPYTDIAHPKMTVDAGWMYGCNSARSGDTSKRGKPTQYEASIWGPFRRVIKTDWLDKTCGHNLKTTDPACSGCVNRVDD